MFEAFQTPTSEFGSRRRLAVSTTAAVGVYALLAAGLFVLGRNVVAPEAERVVEVAFERAKPKPLPPPPPPKVVPRRPKVVAPPSAVAAPPPPRPLEIPKEIPKEAPPETAPTGGPAPAAIGDGHGSGVAGGVLGGTAAPAAVAVVAGPPKPVDLPEEATPPVPSPDNVPPTYPEVARATGLEGVVILKFVITREGTVANIKVLKGEGPLAEAALAALKNYTFTPAMLEGRPIATHKIMKFPFRLSVGG